MADPEKIYEEVANANPNASDSELNLLFVLALCKDDNAVGAFLDQLHEEIAFDRFNAAQDALEPFRKPS